MTSEKDRIKSEFIRRLNLAMEKRGFYEDKQLAQAADISAPSISGWRNGPSFPGKRALKALSQVLDLNAEWLACKSDSEPNWETQPSDLDASNSGLVNNREPSYLEGLASPFDDAEDGDLKDTLLECARTDDWGSVEFLAKELHRRKLLTLNLKIQQLKNKQNRDAG